ncbi:hypothetical protein MMC07_005781 [Pseudocyphellaria aurata]|nr:hypothetical protein [Pseudocyphellaria aurata]
MPSKTYACGELGQRLPDESVAGGQTRGGGDSMMSLSLPGSLFDTYSFYKKGTIAFIRWLSAQDKKAAGRAFVNSVDELRYLADAAIAKRVKIPAGVLSDLKETIRARTRVSKFFKALAKPSDQDVSSSHEYFTATLLQIHRDLTALTQQSRTASATAHTTPNKSPPKRSANVFGCLECDDCIGNDNDWSVGEKCASPSEVAPTCVLVNESAASTNDDIGEFMALAVYLSQLDHLMRTVKETWEQVAAGLTPTVVAASTTSMAYQAAARLAKDLEEYQIYNPDQFLTKYSACLQSLNLSGASFDASRLPPELAPFRGQKGPQQGWLALVEFKSWWDSPGAVTDLHMMENCDCCRAGRPRSFPSDDPMDFLGNSSDGSDQGDDQTDRDRQCLQLTLKRMGQLSNLKCANLHLQFPYNTPLVQELACFLEHNADISGPGAPHAMSLSFGLELLVQGMKSCLQAPAGNTMGASAGPQAQGRSTVKKPGYFRVQSLKLAIGVQGSLAHLMATPNAPCGCLRIGSYGVADLLNTTQVLLQQFVDTKRFDIFYQNPWVSGQHMVENLIRASYFGGKAWHHAYYVGTTFHIYHTLRRLEAIKSTDFPVMESLCHRFEETVFLGQRPTRNLLSCYQRWLGGSLSFPKGHCNEMHTHRQSNGPWKKWTLKPTKDASQGGNHEKRDFNPMKISLFSLVSTRNFNLTDDVLAWASKKDKQAARNKRDGDSFVARSVEAVRDKLAEEFRGDLPVAKINYFAIYELCVDILKHINEAEHPTQDPDQICSCVARRLLAAADEYIHDTHVFKTYPERSLLEHCTKGFEAKLQNKTIADFVWDV